MLFYFRDLSSNALTGKIPTQLGSLANLVGLYDISIFSSISFGDCFFQGFVFQHIDRRYTNTIGIFDLSQPSVWLLFFHQFTLKIVFFRRLFVNSLSGEIPTELGSLTNLYFLYIIFIFL